MSQDTLRAPAVPAKSPTISLVERCAMILAMSWVLSVPVLAAATAVGEIEIDISAQPLDKALSEFAAQSGFQILYDSDLAARRQSPAVKGRLTAQAALSELLAGSGLILRFTGERSVTLASRVERADVIPLATLRVEALVSIGGKQSFEHYARLVQSAVVGRLEQDRTTKFGDYRLSLSLWLDPEGNVRKVALDRGTGDRVVDSAIPGRIQSLSIGQAPPTAMPQPIRIRVNARSVKEAGAN